LHQIKKKVSLSDFRRDWNFDESKGFRGGVTVPDEDEE
jgi:hypothetical protein